MRGFFLSNLCYEEGDMGFEEEVRNAVKNLGGWFNANGHIDRAFVMESKYVGNTPFPL